MKKEKIKMLTVSAIMVALSTVLSFLKVYDLPLGGSITVLSMLPVCMIGLLFGIKAAVLPCLLYGAIQMMIGGVFGWGLTPAVLIGAIVFDYLLAFGVLCFSGSFRKKGFVGIIFGIGLACVLRFACHMVSGCIFFRSFDVFSNPYIYSLVYNGSYMLPELILTVIGAVVIFKTLFKIPFFKNLIKD